MTRPAGHREGRLYSGQPIDELLICCCCEEKKLTGCKTGFSILD